MPDVVTTPTLGEVRLKWWSDALVEALVGDGSPETPVLRAISRTIIRHALPIAPFTALIEARSADLYSDPPATLADLEGRLGETESVLFQMAAIITGARGPETADAAGHAGIAYGLARHLGRFASERARGRTILPADVLHKAGLSAPEIFASKPPDRLFHAIATAVQAARNHLTLAESHVAKLPRDLRSVFLPLAAVVPMLKRIERLGTGIAARDAYLPDIEVLARFGVRRLLR